MYRPYTHVCEYLLKTIDKQELASILNKIAKSIRDKESSTSQIFGTNKYIDAALDVSLKAEVLKLITSMDKTS